LAVEFVAHLYAWNGASETGPALYPSSPRTTTTVAGSERFDFFSPAARYRLAGVSARRWRRRKTP
jgi:hypothetical protein